MHGEETQAWKELVRVHVHGRAGRVLPCVGVRVRVFTCGALYAAELVQPYVCEQQTTEWK